MEKKTKKEEGIRRRLKRVMKEGKKEKNKNLRKEEKMTRRDSKGRLIIKNQFTKNYRVMTVYEIKKMAERVKKEIIQKDYFKRK